MFNSSRALVFVVLLSGVWMMKIMKVRSGGRVNFDEVHQTRYQCPAAIPLTYPPKDITHLLHTAYV